MAAPNAAWALGALGRVEALPRLRERLEDGGPSLRANAALALAALRDRQSLPALRSRIRREDSVHVRAALALALGSVPDDRSASALRAHLDASLPLGQVAADALAAITSGVPLTMPRGGALFRSRLVGADGEPAAGERVTLVLPDRRFVELPASPSGEVTVRDLPEGPVFLGVGATPGS